MASVARDVMDPEPLIVSPDLPVRELAAMLVSDRHGGACVLDQGNILGVVTAMDLVFQSQPPHMPSFFHFLEALIPLESPAKTEHDLRKIVGATVREVMNSPAICVGPEEPLSAIAERMVGKHLSLVPVVSDGRLLGVVTKAGIIRHAYGL